ncbi:MAG: energy-coupling factor transporter transmembrane protein EcfT, partial [Acidimicrobiaceae bacterium]|nr:energy-coupling factor transporter transmembrane protein EcfT [Acidimicrobiaceae bacterium]
INRGRPSRTLHPLAWWAWAVGLAVACLRTTNPLLLGLIAGVVFFVVASCRSSGPWGRSFGVFVRFGLVVVAIRVVIEMVFGQRLGGHTLFVLPELHLPQWAAGVSVGGPVTLESLLGSLWQGLRLAVLLICFGAANSLASPYRLLRCLPAFLYEAGVAVTVALSFTPQVAASLVRLRQARRLRGRPARGIAGLRGMAVPVLSGALDRSLQLAASMDSRGYGRRAGISRRTRLLTGVLTIGGLLASTGGLYWTLTGGSESFGGGSALAAGIAALVASMALAGRRNPRTRYRPDPWRRPEWLTAGVGALALSAFAATSAGLQASVYPVRAPALPLLPALAALACALPAMITARPVARSVDRPTTAFVAGRQTAATPAARSKAGLG